MASIAQIIHLSDVHFGLNNITEVVGPSNTRRSLASLVLRDLLQPAKALPMLLESHVEKVVPEYERVICITGDFSVSGDGKEFKQAREFLDELTQGLKWDQETARSRVIIIPGNHDLKYTDTDPVTRWAAWRDFYDRFYGIQTDPNDPLSWVRLFRVQSADVAVLCLDSEYHIHANSEYKHCGVVDEGQIEHVEQLLEGANDDWFKRAIKVCLVHHHPILIPSLVELGRGAGQTNNQPGYDAVFNAQKILNLLHRYGFQLLLHGHKHIPHVFTEDIVNACHRDDDHSMIVVAGGTLGANDQQSMAGWSQCYNQILVHWNEKRHSTRTEITTRGLVRTDPYRHELTWSKWHWTTMRTVDRFSSPWLTTPEPNIEKLAPENPHPIGSPEDTARISEYERLRGNMLVVEIRPSLVPGQDYEAKFWITPHISKTSKQTLREVPERVTWSAGQMFPRITIAGEDDPSFCGTYHCYAPMLLQAELFFKVGPSQRAYIYARNPEVRKG